MNQTTLRLALERSSGISCNADGLFVGETPLLARWPGPSGGQGEWRPRPLDDLNLDLAKCYGLPIDFRSKIGGLRVVAAALSGGDLVRAQIAALHLQLPDPVNLAKGAINPPQVVELLSRLGASGILKAGWDEALHPRWPAGSADSTGGEFAPGGGGAADALASGNAAANAGKQPQSADGSGRTLHFATDLVEPDGSILGKFYVLPPSKVGGVIVQKIVSTDTLYGKVVDQRVGWEAWKVEPRAIAAEGSQPDDDWKAPPPNSSRPSVAAVRTITGEARFYEGITVEDLVNKYGFSIGGSGFSGQLLSTKRDPHLPTDGSTPPLKRTRTMLKW